MSTERVELLGLLTDVVKCLTTPMAPARPSKCLVSGCENMSNQGTFVGDLCAPCHDMLTTGRIESGETFIHEMRGRLRKIANIAA